ncbi:MAG: tetratricopeptide repeat protein [Thermoanaerobaculia bacterium]
MPTSPVAAPGVAAIHWTRALPALLLVVAAALAVYLPTPGNYWIRYDNEALIRSSPQVAAFAGDDKLGALVTMFTSTHSSLYQPLFTLSVAIDHALFGWDLAGFHAHSVLLHVVTAALLLFALFRLTGSWLAATAATMLFAVHPALVETVRWAICRNSQVAALWLLAGVLLYLWHLERPSAIALWSSQAAFGLSLLGKVSPGIVVVPFVLDLWRHRRFDRRAVLEKLPLLALSLLLTFANYRATLEHVAQSPLQRPWSEVFGFLPGSVALMTANAMAPAKLAILYSPAAMGALIGWRWTIVAALLLAAVGGGAWAWRRGHRGVVLGLVAWFALLLPNIAAGRFRTTIASDRYLYIPIVFLAAALAAVLAPLLRPEGGVPGGRSARRIHTAGRWIAIVAVLALTLAWGRDAVAQAHQWENERRLWTRVNELAPHYMAYYMLGNMALSEEKWGEAAELFSQALDLAQLDPYAQKDPVYASAVMQTSRKAASELAKQPATASQADREALLARVEEVATEAAANLPASPEIQFELGKTRYKQKSYSEAIVALDAAIALDAQHYQAWTYKAMSLYFLGQKEEAIATFRKSLAIRPYWVTFSNLSKVHLAEGQLNEALDVLLGWLQLDPASDEAHRRFLQTAGELVGQGAKKEAIGQLERYLARFPDSAPAQSLLQAAQAIP